MKLLLSILFFSLTLTAFGQDYPDLGYRDPDDYSFVDGGVPFSKYLGKFKHNDCIRWYYDTARKGKVNFKTVTHKHYTAKDTGKNSMELENTYVFNFNNLGMLTGYHCLKCDEYSDDSTIVQYDSQFNKIRQTSYTKRYSPGKMTNFLASDEFFKWDNKFHLLWDSTFSQYKQRGEDTSLRTCTQVFTKKYDQEGNLLENTEKYYGDTTMHYVYTYMNGHVTSIKNTLKNEVSYTTIKYDNLWNEIERCKISCVDTILTIQKFDTKNRLVESNHYEHGVLIYSFTATINQDGSYTTTSQVFPAGGESCSKFNTTINHYGKDSTLISSEETGEENGRSYKINTLHFYKFNGGEVLYDSSIRTEEKKFFFSKTVWVTVNKYDDRGNNLENLVISGERSSKTEYEYNSRNKMIKETHYDDCLESPSKTITYVYYSDGISLKEKTCEIHGEITKWRFSEDSRILEKYELKPYYHSKGNGEVTLDIYTY
jgi:hypothetical protein